MKTNNEELTAAGLPWWNIVAEPGPFDVALTAVKTQIQRETPVIGDINGADILNVLRKSRTSRHKRRAALISHSKDGTLIVGKWRVVSDSQGLGDLGRELRRKGVRDLYLLGCSTAEGEIGYNLRAIQDNLNHESTPTTAIRLWGTREPIGADRFGPLGLKAEYEDRTVVPALNAGSSEQVQMFMVYKWLARYRHVERTAHATDAFLQSRLIWARQRAEHFALWGVTVAADRATPANAASLGNACESVVALAPPLLAHPDAEMFFPSDGTQAGPLASIYYGGRLLCVQTNDPGTCIYYVVRESSRLPLLESLGCR